MGFVDVPVRASMSDLGAAGIDAPWVGAPTSTALPMQGLAPGAGSMPSSLHSIPFSNRHPDPSDPQNPLAAAADLGLLHLPPLLIPAERPHPPASPTSLDAASSKSVSGIAAPSPVLGVHGGSDRGSTLPVGLAGVGEAVASISTYPSMSMPTTRASEGSPGGAAAPWAPEHPEGYGQESPSDSSGGHGSLPSSRHGPSELQEQPAVERSIPPRYEGTYEAQNLYGGWSGGGAAAVGNSTVPGAMTYGSEGSAQRPIGSQGTAAYGAAGGYAASSNAYAPSYSSTHYPLPSSGLPLAARLEGRPHLNPDKAAIVRDRIRTVLLEDMRTSVYQVEVHRVTIARMQGTNRVNATKLLNAANITRGKRDGILKNEKDRDIVKQGTMPLKGQWVPLERARKLASQFNLTSALYPLLEDDLPEYVQAVGPLTPRYGALASYLPTANQPLAGPSTDAFSYATRPPLGVPGMATASASSSAASSYYGTGMPTLQTVGLQQSATYYPSPSKAATPYTATFPLPPASQGLLSPRPDIGERRRTFPLQSDPSAYGLPSTGSHPYQQSQTPASAALSAQSSQMDVQHRGSDYEWPAARPALTSYTSQSAPSYAPGCAPTYGSQSSVYYGGESGVPRSASPLRGFGDVGTAQAGGVPASRTISSESEADAAMKSHARSFSASRIEGSWSGSGHPRDEAAVSDLGATSSDRAAAFPHAPVSAGSYQQSTAEWLESTGLGYHRPDLDVAHGAAPS